jgi:mRNA interferase RelE/StbE
MLVEYETKAIKDLKVIDPKTRARIITKINQYADAPESQANNVMQLTGSSYFRLRVADYRVVFATDGEIATVMTVIRVRHRREAYAKGSYD